MGCFLLFQKREDQDGIQIFRHGYPVIPGDLENTVYRQDSVYDIQRIKRFFCPANQIRPLLASGRLDFGRGLAQISVLHLLRIRIFLDIKHPAAIGNMISFQSQIHRGDRSQQVERPVAIGQGMEHFQ